MTNTPIIKFGVWAPDQETFWKSWERAKIAEKTEDGDWKLAPEYSDLIVGTSWGGIVSKPTGNMIDDGEGNQIPEMASVPGWHTNVVVKPGSPTEQQFTYGREQYEADGETPLSIWDRTWSTSVFRLTWRDEDPTTHFPAGYANDDGVVFADDADFHKNGKSPANIIAI